MLDMRKIMKKVRLLSSCIKMANMAVLEGNGYLESTVSGRCKWRSSYLRFVIHSDGRWITAQFPINFAMSICIHVFDLH